MNGKRENDPSTDWTYRAKKVVESIKTNQGYTTLPTMIKVKLVQIKNYNCCVQFNESNNESIRNITRTK